MTGTACSGCAGCTCGGIAVMTPSGESNPPGASTIAYRTGVWATFRESMLANLSSAEFPALAGLKTRARDDFSIALLDASAVVLDILTFYQERLANESYLRTATQLWSLTQLCRLIGYQPSPGVSASAYLAFTLTAAPGLPTNPATGALTIPAGTTVQSVATQSSPPQAFQTSADMLGKPDWNALQVQTGNPWTASASQTSIWLDGVATQLQPGDVVLIVGDAASADASSQAWMLAQVSSVQPDSANARTLVRWNAPLATSSLALGGPSPSACYALRQKAALFGYSAINPPLMSYDTQAALYEAGLLNGPPITPPAAGSNPTGGGSQTPPDWNFLPPGSGLLDLDAVYSKITAPAWAVMSYPAEGVAPGCLGVFAVQSAATIARSAYGASAKITRMAVTPGAPATAANNQTLDTYYLQHTRDASILVQSEALPVTEQPLDYPLYGTFLDFESVRDDLAGVSAVAIAGKRQKVVINANAGQRAILRPPLPRLAPLRTLAPQPLHGSVLFPVSSQLLFQPYDDSSSIETLQPGDVLTLMAPPSLPTSQEIPDWTQATDRLTLVVADAHGRAGTLTASLSDFTLAPSDKSDPLVQEIGIVSRLSQTGAQAARRTRIGLKTPLLNCYERASTTVNCNVCLATGGSAVTELLGSGSGSTPNQAFTLKQAPLTYVPAETPGGAQGTLKVAVNGATWTPLQSLYKQKSSAQVYQVVNEAGGVTRVQFGDGVEAAMIPTGVSNIVANYRVGLGQAGNVGSGAITTLVDRPLGVKSVTNPSPATGGQDAQALGDIRATAPMTVTTLGRAVSITDYQAFAATYAGIAKAFAQWVPNGPACGVYITVAGAGGASLAGSDALARLQATLTAYGDPGVLVQVQSFYETLFGLTAEIAYDPAYDQDAVQAQLRSTLASTYGFAARDFGLGVSSDEIAALLQAVPGVIAVNVRLAPGPTSAAGDLGAVGWSVAGWNSWIAQQKTLPDAKASADHICPYTPIAPRNGGPPPPACILVLNPNPAAVVLTVMG